MKGLNQLLNVLIFLGLSAVLYIAYSHFYQNTRKPVSGVETSSSYKPKDYKAVTNKYLKEAQLQKSLQDLQKLRAKDSYPNNPAPEKFTETNPDTVPVEKQIWSDPASKSNLSVEEKFAQEQAQKLLAKAKEESEEKAYIEEWKANARKDGYDIEIARVNGELQEVSRKPIRKPTNDFDSNNSSPEY